MSRNEREISSSCREGGWTSIYYILGMYAIDLWAGFKLFLFKLKFPSLVSVLLFVKLVN